VFLCVTCAVSHVLCHACCVTCAVSHVLRHMCCSALQSIAPRGVSFVEQSIQIREDLAELLEKEEEWSKAAQVKAS